MRKARCGVPPASWIERVATTLRARHDLTIEHFLDQEGALAAWFAEGLEPEAASALDAIDLALAKWLSRLASRSTYLQALKLLGRALGDTSLRPARALIDRAVANPKSLELELATFAARTDVKTGTVRGRLIPLTTATRVLERAKLAPRVLRIALPARDVDADVTPASRQAILAADRYLVALGTPMAARTRAILHLAVGGLKPGELVDMTAEDLHLEASKVRVGESMLRIEKAAGAAIRRWLEHRGRSPGPLFAGFDGRTGRLATTGITPRQMQREVEAVGRAVGERLTLSSLRRRLVVDARDTRSAQVFARVNNPSDVYRLRSPKRRPHHDV